MTIEERAKQSATNIIDWCYDMDMQAQEQDPNFVTNEIVRAMKWERKECIDKACEWLKNNTPIGLMEDELSDFFEDFKNAMEE